MKIILRGSLAFTGEGHGALRAVALGVLGFKPETIDMNAAENALLELDRAQQIEMSVGGVIQFDPKSDIVLDYEQPVALHPNEIECVLYGSAETVVWRNTYYSTGGGFIASRKQLEAPTRDDIVQTGNEVPYEFSSAAELLALCCQHDAAIRDIILSNEDAKRSHDETLSSLATIKQVMMDCIDRGLETQGILPGGLEVTRRAPGLWEKLLQQPQANEKEQLFDWLNVYAMAVNEENAAGIRVQTRRPRRAKRKHFFCPRAGSASCISNVPQSRGLKWAAKERWVWRAQWRPAGSRPFGAGRLSKSLKRLRSGWSII